MQLPNLPIIPPDILALLDAHMRHVMMTMNCVKIGVIEDFAPGGIDPPTAPTVTVSIAQKQVVDIATDGTVTLGDYPPLYKVPVHFARGGGFTITMPISKGDECLILFNDRQLDNWLTSGAGSPPSVGRIHDISDGIAIVGLFSNPTAIANILTDRVQIRKDDGSTFVEINNDGVNLHSGHISRWDCYGYGQKITYNGGGVWTIDNYMTPAAGQTVNVNNHNIANPGALP